MSEEATEDTSAVDTGDTNSAVAEPQQTAPSAEQSLSAIIASTANSLAAPDRK